MLKVIVAGSRDFNDYELLQNLLDMYLQRYSRLQIEIISGGARGADKLGERYAQSRGIKVKIITADWRTYGRSAGYRRNEEMAKLATHCVVFWDGQSRGTAHMINLANQYKLALRIVRFKKLSIANS